MGKDCLYRFISLKLLLAGLLVGLSGAPVAAVELTKFPQSTLLQEDPLAGRYIAALGPLRNINGRWQPDEHLDIDGVGTRQVFELPRGSRLDEVLASYQQQLQLLGAQPLFFCAAHRCGSSASWANEFFAERRLYGLDQHQRYAVYQIAGEQSDRIVKLYMVTRGNQRSFLLLDQIQLQRKVAVEPSVDTVQALLQQGQHVQIPLEVSGDNIVINSVYQAIIARLLKVNPSLRLVLAVSDHRTDSFDTNRQRSQELGETLAADLKIGSGLSARLQIEGIGNIAPRRAEPVIVWLLKYQ